MNIKHQGKKYSAKRNNQTGQLTIKVGSKNVFAGYGEGNMCRGFSIVHGAAPKKVAGKPS